MWLEVKETNRGAFLIAKGAALPQFGQSYVAAGHQFWLTKLFDNEKSASSVYGFLWWYFLYSMFSFLHGLFMGEDLVWLGLELGLVIESWWSVYMV